MGDHRLLKLALNSNQNHLRLKQGWYKDIKTWLDHWAIDENVALRNINDIKNIVTSSLKRKCVVRKILRLKES